MSGEAPPMTRLFRGDHRSEHLAALQAFTAFVEGYGDHAVARAGAGLLPDLDRIAEAHSRRRSEPNQGEQALGQLIGLELHRHRAGDAAAFCDEVARRWGEEALATVWDGPDRLPTLGELTDPVGWAARVLLEA
jgi:putative hydrolase